MNYFECVAAHGGGSSNTITVTCDSGFAGLTLTCTDGNDTYTKVCPSVSPYTVDFENLAAGTWTISGTVQGTSYSKSVEISDSYATSLESGFSWATWVDLSQNYSSTDYNSLSDVLADEDCVHELMTIHACADYLIDAVSDDIDVIDDFVANDTAMKWIGLRDYTCDGLTAIAGVEAKFLASQYWERYLKDHVPTMTSNNAPYGTASATNNSSGAYKAFNGTNESGTSDAYEGSGLNIRLEYEFPTPICVKKILVANRNNSTVYAIENFKLQGSNDGTTWTDIGSFTKADGEANEETFSAASNTTYFKKLGIYITSTYDTSSNHYSRVGKLQFYGRSLNVSVPVMTSNTAPFGSLSGNAISDAPLYMGFDADKTNYTAISDGGKCVYDFLSKYVIKAIEVYSNSSNNYYAKAVQLIGSDDNTNFTSIGESQTLNNAANSVFFFYPNNNTAYRYNGISITSNITGGQSTFKIINFYGLDYSEREFEPNSGKKWLYDHGVELETLTTSGTVTKGSDYLTLSAANSEATASVDLTDYSVLRCKVGDHMSGTTQLSVGGSNPAAATLTANYSPDNNSLGVSSFNQSLATGVKMTANGVCDITEIWVE